MTAEEIRTPEEVREFLKIENNAISVDEFIAAAMELVDRTIDNKNPYKLNVINRNVFRTALLQIAKEHLGSDSALDPTHLLGSNTPVTGEVAGDIFDLFEQMGSEYSKMLRPNTISPPADSSPADWKKFVPLAKAIATYLQL